jgi:hypothetical protein
MDKAEEPHVTPETVTLKEWAPVLRTVYGHEKVRENPAGMVWLTGVIAPIVPDPEYLVPVAPTPVASLPPVLKTVRLAVTACPTDATGGEKVNPPDASEAPNPMVTEPDAAGPVDIAAPEFTSVPATEAVKTTLVHGITAV